MEATLRELKTLRLYHRNKRKYLKHNIAHKEADRLIKKKQAAYYEKQETLFTKIFLKALGKIQEKMNGK